MAFDGRIYRILIASPSDVEEEREIAVRVIQEWNDLYSYSRKVVLLPLRWETHTAPEYGTRPQEVINKAIVDQCDLLVGIFWTRIGSPTGVADSGTLEEIERVGLADKPIMLYFSKVGIDPDKIDLVQIEKLKQFKAKSYPKGLVESYKSHIEFRDKFARQLELKVRELQKNEDAGIFPLVLNFLSLDDKKLVGDKNTVSVMKSVVNDIDKVPGEKRDKISQVLNSKIDQTIRIPVALAIENASSSGVRNVYIEMEFTCSMEDCSLSDEHEFRTSWAAISSWTKNFAGLDYVNYTDHFTKSKGVLFQSDTLVKTDKGWKLSFDWEAIQPQRTRVIKPILYFSPKESASLLITAKIFADSFPEPVSLCAELIVEFKTKSISLNEALPNWAEILEKEDETEGT